MTSASAITAQQSSNRKWLVLLAIGVGTFMSALDGSVVNTTLPVITRDFRSDVATMEWVVTVYLLVVSGLLLSFGRLGDLRGHRPVYLTGFTIFIVSSAVCGLAQSPLMLIGSRAIQALGAAMLFANSPAILTKNFPASERGRALGLQGTMTYLGLTAGQSLGGWLTEQFSWRAVFYINVPVGLLALWLSWRFIPKDAPAERAEKFDRAGAAVFMAGLIALLLGLNQGSSWGWTSPAILGLLLGAVGLLAVFIAVERRVANPMLDLTLFRSRTFSASTASAILNYVCVYSILFLLPFYLIYGRNLSPAVAGAILTTQPIVMAIVAPLSGQLSDRVGARVLSVLGMLVLALGLWLLSQLRSQSPLSDVTLALAVVGLGTGTFIAPNSSALMGAAPRHRQGIAAGVLASARNVGMVLGVGLAGAVFTTVQAQTASVVTAVTTSFAVAIGLAVLGIFTSAIRGA
ncbi:MAG: MFS transporter [Chloroflexi bacterium]|nr:MFS transporter [Chloroflexota bacterium]